IFRNGKHLIFELNNNKYWIVHLRMTGTFSIHDKSLTKDELILSSTIALFYFDDFILRFDSSRKFSTFDIINQYEYDIFLPKSKVNLDPLSDECNKEFLYNQTKKISRPIKTVLLDQSVISGIGNIYADEILFCSKIHPNTPANKLTINDIELIVRFSKEILSESIKHNGTTVHSFSYNGVDSGQYQNYLKIHHSKIKQCPDCDNKVSFIKMNGRGTYYCNKCQKDKY
ncbi:MAG: DNA-formamidopyrimidine glycosylase, partial [Ureaplasma sp.]|nr:DNA-formamidopyrimidine glycosylase [Ureaplasma sp.]